jgi:hypothetical protein
MAGSTALCCLPYLLFKIRLGDSAWAKSPSGNGQAREITVVIAAAKIDGRPAMRLLKHSGKVLDGGESALCRNIADRQIGMVKQSLRILEPDSRQEFADRVTGLEVEELRQPAS